MALIKSYVVDAYSMYAASAFAANTMIRSGVAAAFPLFTTQMFKGVSQVTSRIFFWCSVGLTLANNRRWASTGRQRLLPASRSCSPLFHSFSTNMGRGFVQEAGSLHAW
jgi:hypothetical protein